MGDWVGGEVREGEFWWYFPQVLSSEYIEPTSRKYAHTFY